MRLHTDKIESCNALRALLPDGVYAYVTQKGSRKRARAFEVTLYVPCKDDLHRRFGNSGGYGSSEDVAATWDEWGLFFVALYEVDPTWTCDAYPTEADFYDRTRRHRDYVRIAHKPEHLEYRTHLAPWLSDPLFEVVGSAVYDAATDTLA